LDHGDYQIEGLPNLITIERKQSIDELCKNLGKHRARFERELQRMQVCKYKYVVIEDSWYSMQDPDFSKLHYHAILGSIITFMIRYGVHFIFANNRKWAHRITKKLLMKAYEQHQKDSEK
jgi:ERCC4-type nuclease